MIWFLLFVTCFINFIEAEFVHYERYAMADCTDPEWEYFNNRSTNDAPFCSDFLFHFSGSFVKLNSSHMMIYIHNATKCEIKARTNETFLVPMNKCIQDPIIGHKYSIWKFVDDYPYPSPNQNITSNLKFLRMIVYTDGNCTTRNLLHFHYRYYPMHKPGFYFYDMADTARSFDSQMYYPQCNKTHLVEYITSNHTYPNEIPDYFEEVSVTYIHPTCQTERFFHEGYKFGCFEDVPAQPNKMKPYFHTLGYWNPACYGSPFYDKERQNDYCMEWPVSFGRVWGKKDFFAKNGHMRKYYDSPTCDESTINRVFFDDTAITDNCIEDESSLITRYIRFKDTEEEFSDPDFFVVLEHYESCEYFKSHPDEFENFKREYRTSHDSTFHYHSTFCISKDTYSGYSNPPTSSLMAKCVDGVVRMTNFTEHTNCDPNEGPVETFEGDACLYLEALRSYVTITCIPFYCNGLPQYSEKVCNGRGTCYADDKCACLLNKYSGDFCENEMKYNSSKDLSNKFPIWLMAVISIIVPGGFLFMVLMLLACCLCVLCTCCLLCCIVCACCSIIPINLSQKSKIKRFKKLKGFEILLKEQLLEDDGSTAHLKINKNLFEIPLADIEIEAILGEGGSNSVVYKASWKGVTVAFKCFRTKTVCASQDRFDEFEEEVSILGSLSHPNIIRFLGASLQPPRVGIVMEYCSNGEIIEFFDEFGKSTGTRYPINEKLRMCREIISSVDYLHTKNIIHRDLKPENILIDSNENCKLMDFGLSRFIKDNDSAKTKAIGTNMYIAPEVMSGQYDEKVDTFSFGIVMFSIFSERARPYEEGIPNLEHRVATNPEFRPDLSQLMFYEDGDEMSMYKSKMMLDLNEQNEEFEQDELDEFESEMAKRDPRRNQKMGGPPDSYFRQAPPSRYSQGDFSYPNHPGDKSEKPKKNKNKKNKKNKEGLYNPLMEDENKIDKVEKQDKKMKKYYRSQKTDDEKREMMNSQYGWLKNIIVRCWAHDPHDRPGFSELLGIFNEPAHGGPGRRVSSVSGFSEMKVSKSMRMMSRSKFFEALRGRRKTVSQGKDDGDVLTRKRGESDQNRYYGVTNVTNVKKSKSEGGPKEGVGASETDSVVVMTRREEKMEKKMRMLKRENKKLVKTLRKIMKSKNQQVEELDIKAMIESIEKEEEESTGGEEKKLLNFEN